MKGETTSMSKGDAIEVEGKVVEPLPVRRQHMARDVGRGVGIVHGMREKRIADSDDVMATAEDGFVRRK
jgi:hypothetical protein